MFSDKTSENAKHAIEILLKLAHLVDVTDHVDGRIVARTSLTSLGKVMAILQGHDVERSLRLIPGLPGYEVSAWSRSATINYDATVIPKDFWDHFRAIGNDPSAEGVVRERLHLLLADGGDGPLVRSDESGLEELAR